MKNWVNFCDIKKRSKNESLAVVVTARFFLENKKAKLLEGKKLMLVPPEIDCPRQLSVNKIKIKSSNTFELEFNEIVDERTNFKDKCLLINKSDFCDVFGKLSSDEVELVGKKVKDKNLGIIGKVTEVRGTKTQKLLVVDHNGNDVYVPYVDEIVVSFDENTLRTNLPSGILEINEG